MFGRVQRGVVAIAVMFCVAVAVPVRAQAVKPATPKPAQPKPKPAPVKESATEPKPREGAWMKRHEGFLAENAKLKDNVDLLFVGDSITDGWRNTGKAVFAENYGALKPFNIGISGDRTQHVIWRLQNGEVEGIKPKLAVLMIGTNNLGANTNEEIVAGITACVKEIQTKLPTTKVLLLGVFPRGFGATDKARQRIKDINAEIAKLDDGGKTVKYLDIGPKFLDAEGNLPKDVMPDALHPNAKGYQIWADAIKDAVGEMMK